MLRRLLLLLVAFLAFIAVLWTSSAEAQSDGVGADEAPSEISSYGDAELIETLDAYGFLDEWINASPVSPQASLLLVTSDGGYQSQRQAFLDALDAWAARTERVRAELARIDHAQVNADGLRSVVEQVHDALVFDDRLATESETLVQIQDALTRLTALEIAQDPPLDSDELLARAEVRLNDLRLRADDEIAALNGVAPALASSGVASFLGLADLRTGLNDVDQLIKQARDIIEPARETSEQLVSTALSQIAALHASRLLGSTEVGGLSVVTVDAYIRAASRSTCSVDWALLAGIGEIESNHGRIGGASVSRSGQVSTNILGPLLDGGQTEREVEEPRLQDPQVVAVLSIVAEVLNANREFARANLQESLQTVLPQFSDVLNIEDQAGDVGNGFAIVLDTDGGRLDGNDRWDRAVGPMQFIPETWSKWATDGNGDGVSDPNNLYDASAAAARFLCDLSATRGSSPSSFLLGYNSSTSYVRSVLSVGNSFRSSALPDA